MYKTLLVAFLALCLAVSMTAFDGASAKDEPRVFAFVVSFEGDVKVADKTAELGMAVYVNEIVKAGSSAKAAIILIDDSLYKIGAGSSVKVTEGLVKGDLTDFPKKNGTWAILMKKFEDRLKAERDLSQYGAIRSSSFDPDLNGYSKSDVRKVVDKTRADLGLADTSASYFLVGGAVWEYYGFYSDARNVYNEGIKRFPTSKELGKALVIVNAKISQ